VTVEPPMTARPYTAAVVHHRPRAVVPCPIDTFAVVDEEEEGGTTTSACQPVQCVRPAPCGPHSVRGLGSNVCGCEPGFYFVPLESACRACATSSSYYCPGGRSPPLPCPEHSIATTTGCQCAAGFLEFQGVCLRCPTSLLCPFNGTLSPLPCYGGGYTLGDGSLSPLECLCPARTYGIRCTPCDAGMDCSAPATPVRAFSALSIAGVAGLGAPGMLEACLASHDGEYWTLNALGSSSSSFALSATTTALPWSWLVVVPGGAAATVSLLQDTCLGPRFLSLTIEVLDDGVPMPNLMMARSCGGEHWYWDPTLQACGCVPGYSFHFFNDNEGGCLPCPNGTVRAEGDPTCGPCPHPGEEEAPWLGMSVCECASGHARDNRTGRCASVTLTDYYYGAYSFFFSPQQRGFFITNNRENAPVRMWLDTHHLPTYLLLGSVALGTGAMCFSLLVLVLL
jgi:hypothetical protein